MEVTLAEAEKRLSELIDAAARGENVVISRADAPVAKIVALPARKVPQFGALGPIQGGARILRAASR